jgi:hypothetical protein
MGNEKSGCGTFNQHVTCPWIYECLLVTPVG